MRTAILYATCIALLFSCKKENVSQQPEASNQQLAKVIKRTNLDANHSYDEVINYEYNDARKIISEGNKTYVRDSKQRIIQILDKSKATNRNDIEVHYSDIDPKLVSYTFCRISSGDPATDSIVYVHDTNGRLIKTMNYIHYFGGTYLTDTILYYLHTVPDTTFLYEYTLFQYDDNGNLKQLGTYSINLNGKPVLCSIYRFNDYDQMTNPQYADDEIRSMQFSFDGVINASKNNFSNVGIYTKSYEYRTDGRPRSCEIKQNGTYAFKLTFEYK